MWLLLILIGMSVILGYFIREELKLKKKLLEQMAAARDGSYHAHLIIIGVSLLKGLDDIAESWCRELATFHGVDSLVAAGENAIQKKEYEQAELLWRVAVGFDVTRAKRALANLYRDKNIKPRESNYLLESAALDGDARSQYEMGKQLAEELVNLRERSEYAVAQIKRKALHFLELSRSQGYFQPDTNEIVERILASY